MNKSDTSSTTYLQSAVTNVSTAEEEHTPGVKEPLMKRPLDVILSSIMIMLSIPIFLPIAFIIKIIQEKVCAKKLAINS